MQKTLLSLAIIFSLVHSCAWSQTPKPAETLTFHVTGFENNTGQAIVYLYRQEDKVPTKPFTHATALIVNKVAEITFPGLSYGDYAAIVVHDLNANGKIDHKWGMPAEPLGYTNKWKFSLFSGMPTFEKLRFHFSASCRTIAITMHE